MNSRQLGLHLSQMFLDLLLFFCFVAKMVHIRARGLVAGFQDAGLTDRITLLLQAYRDLSGE